MSYVAKGDKDFESAGASAPKSHKIRITLTSRNVKNLEKGKLSFRFDNSILFSYSIVSTAPRMGSGRVVAREGGGRTQNFRRVVKLGRARGNWCEKGREARGRTRMFVELSNGSGATFGGQGMREGRPNDDQEPRFPASH